MRSMMFFSSILLCVGSFSQIVWAQPGRLPATKKLIEYGWDVPTPAYVKEHIQEMEKRPFDGVIMRLAGKGRGNIFMGGRWDPKDFERDQEALAAIRWDKFKHNFLMMYAASEQDWFSDEDWANVLHNVRIMAECARAGGCHLAFDAEPYGKNPWAYAEQKHAKEKSYAEYAAKARQRGRQFIETIQSILPDSVLLTLFTFSIFPAQMEQDPAKREETLKQHGYGLYLPFLHGMLEGLGPRMTITDGNEPSYYYDSSEKYFSAYHMMRQRALNLVPPELVPKFQTNTQASQALYVDYVFAKVPWPNIPARFMTPEEQAKWFEHNVYWALRTTDEFVWLYSEKMNWWTNTDLPPGLEQAVINAREAIAQNRGLGFDIRELMKNVQARREAEIAQKIVRRTKEIPALRDVPSPNIDGELEDPAWQQAAVLEPFIGYFGTKPEDIKAPTEARVTYDATALYIAVRAHEPQMKEIEIVGAQRDDAIWMGDSIDIFISAAESGSPYYHFIINPHNVQWDAYYSTENDMSYNPQWQSATKMAEKEWRVEIAIPWQELKITPTSGLQLRANIARQRRPGNEQTSWSQYVSGFLESNNFGTWILR